MLMVSTATSDEHFMMTVHCTLDIHTSRHKQNIIISGLPEAEETDIDDRQTLEMCETFLYTPTVRFIRILLLQFSPTPSLTLLSRVY